MIKNFESRISEILGEGIYREHGESVLDMLTEASNDISEAQHELGSTYDPGMIADLIADLEPEDAEKYGQDLENAKKTWPQVMPAFRQLDAAQAALDKAIDGLRDLVKHGTIQDIEASKKAAYLGVGR